MTGHRPPQDGTDLAILRVRARALAQVPEMAASEASVLEVVEFRLAGERYAVESRYVREIIELRHLTPLPGAPPFLLGIVNVRGHIVPVVDLKQFFDLPDVGLADLHHVVLIDSHGLAFGLLADTTVAVQTLPLSSLQPGLPTLTGIRAEYLKGVTADRLVVLDIDRLASDPAIIVNQDTDS